MSGSPGRPVPPLVLAAALHTATGTWTVPLAALTAALLLCAAAGMRAGHDPE